MRPGGLEGLLRLPLGLEHSLILLEGRWRATSGETRDGERVRLGTPPVSLWIIPGRKISKCIQKKVPITKVRNVFRAYGVILFSRTARPLTPEARRLREYNHPAQASCRGPLLHGSPIIECFQAWT